MSTPSHWRLRMQDTALLHAGGLMQRAREMTSGRYVVALLATAAIAVVIGASTSAFAELTNGPIAWWPAAGACAVVFLLFRGPRWQAVLAVAGVSAITALTGDRSPVVSFSEAAAVTTAAVAFGILAGTGGREALLASTRGLARFSLAAVAAALAAGAVAATLGALFGGDPMGAAFAATPAVFLGIATIAPVALIPLPRRTPGQAMELALQIVSVSAVAGYVFMSSQTDSIGALLVPFLAWAAARFVPLVVTVEVAALSAVTVWFSYLGSGPFADAANVAPTATLVQLYLLSITAAILLLIVWRSERSALRDENERSAALLRGGFVGSQVGSLFLRADPDTGPSIIEMNDVAQGLIDGGWFVELAESWIDDGGEEFSTEVTLDNGHTVQVYGRRVQTSDGDRVLAIQLVDVTDLILAQDALKKTVALEKRMVEELREMAVQKDDFVSAVSHELRTPITSIVGFAEDLYDTATEEQREYAGIIVRNATRLTAMVEELLELGRMTSPNPVRNTRSMDLSTVIREIVQDQSVSARDHGVEIVTHLSPGPAFVLGNANALDRIVTNVLSNAIKFTPAGGTVTITTEVDAARSRVSMLVDDSGPGISAEDAPRVFERFYRSSSPDRRKTPGTGLGLSIVKALVEAFEGTIAIERSPSGGARIAIEIPVVTEQASPNAD